MNLLLFDGVCNLCTGSVRFIIPRDPQGNIHFASLQSDAGQKILSDYGLSTEDFDTMVFVQDGKAYLRSDAVLKIAGYLRWPWSMLRAFLWVPRFIRDWFYLRVARSRYRWFGKSESCMIPTPEIKSRFLE